MFVNPVVSSCRARGGRGSGSGGKGSGKGGKCTDTPGFKDQWGFTCKTYKAKQYCTSDGEVGAGWEASWGGGLGDEAVAACCACGGGKTVAGAKGSGKGSKGSVRIQKLY